MNFKKIKINEIKKSRFNVRKEYDLESMDISEGYTHKPVVIPTEKGHYEILVGHRRVEKARNEGLTEIECEIREGLTDEEVLKEQARENLQRKGWTPIEEGRHFEIQRRHGLLLREIAGNIGKSERYVQQRLFLLDKLNPQIMNSVRYPAHDPSIDTYSITLHKALELARLDEQDQKMLSDLIEKRGLTTKELNKRIQNGRGIETVLEQEKVNAEVEKHYYLTVDQVKELKEKYYPLKFEKNSIKRLLNEIDDIKEKMYYTSPRMLTVYLPKKHNDLFPSYNVIAEGFTEEEAQEYANKYHGRIIGEKTFTFYEVNVAKDREMTLAHAFLIETNPIKILYSKKRCEKCGQPIEQRMHGVWCAHCVYQSKRKELDELRRRR